MTHPIHSRKHRRRIGFHLRALMFSALLVVGTNFSLVSLSVAASSDVLSLKTAIHSADLQAINQLAKAKAGGVMVGIVSAGKLVWTRSHGVATSGPRISQRSRDDLPHRLGHETIRCPPPTYPQKNGPTIFATIKLCHTLSMGVGSGIGANSLRYNEEVYGEERA